MFFPTQVLRGSGCKLFSAGRKLRTDERLRDVPTPVTAVPSKLSTKPEPPSATKVRATPGSTTSAGAKRESPAMRIDRVTIDISETRTISANPSGKGLAKHPAEVDVSKLPPIYREDAAFRPPPVDFPPQNRTAQTQVAASAANNVNRPRSERSPSPPAACRVATRTAGTAVECAENPAQLPSNIDRNAEGQPLSAGKVPARRRRRVTTADAKAGHGAAQVAPPGGDAPNRGANETRTTTVTDTEEKAGEKQETHVALSARSLFGRHLVGREGKCADALPLPPDAESLFRKFQALNVVYGFLTRRHVQPSLHNTRTTAAGESILWHL